MEKELKALEELNILLREKYKNKDEECRIELYSNGSGYIYRLSDDNDWGFDDLEGIIPAIEQVKKDRL